MCLVLRSAWCGVLRAGALAAPARVSRTLATFISEAARARVPDAVTVSLKAAPSAGALLAAVQAHLPAMTHKHMLQALRCLFHLHKNRGRYEDDASCIMKDPAFMVLCQNFKKHARELDVNEAIEATKVLSYLGVPVDSLIVQTMLQLVRCNINMINIRQIMFLHFLIDKFDARNHQVDALKLALPLVFQIHLPLELDRHDLPLLREMLSYCCSYELPDRCINNVVTALLLNDHTIDAHMAKSIVWSLCQVNCTEEVHPTRVQLLHLCYDILAQSLSELTYDEVLRTAAKVKGRVLEKHPEYYHEQLMDAVANYVVDNKVEFEKALLVARVMSRIAHTHLGLVEYICRLAASTPDCLSTARTNVLFNFINCLSNNNFTPEPEEWQKLRRQMSENPVLNVKNFALPWPKVCLELASLGHYEDRMISKVFSEEFLDVFLSRGNNVLDYLQLLTLQEAVNAFHSTEQRLPDDVLRRAREMYPMHAMTEHLEQHLANGLGGPEYLVRNVMLPNGIVADLVMCLKGGYPVALPRLSSNEKVAINNLNLPSGSIVVCVMNFGQGCFSMNSNRLRGTFRLVLDILEKNGYAAVPINVSEWLKAPSHERTSYLMREVGYKCGEIGMKLSAV